MSIHNGPVKMYNNLSIGSLNVCGLKRRSDYPEFQDLMNQFDVLCIDESKLDNDDMISI